MIGNSNYVHADMLPNPQNDAAAIGAALSDVDFEVQVLLDLDQRGMQAAFRDFGLKAETAEVALVYFAGHGIQVDSHNYLLPVDAELKRERDLIYEATPLDVVMAEVAQARQLGMVILDSCRNNPLAENLRQSLGPVRSKLVGLGMARVEDVPPDTLIAFSTRFDQLAYDGWTDLSPFTQALVKHIEEPGLELDLFFRKVRDTVMELTADRQEPRTLDALGATPFYFQAPKSNQPPVIAKLDPLVVSDDSGPVAMEIKAPVDPDEDALSIEIMGLPTIGSVEGPDGPINFGDQITVAQLGDLQFRPEQGNIGVAGAFLFVARDGRGGVTAGRLTIDVARSNKPPVVAKEQEIVWPMIPLGIQEPTDPDGDDLSVTVVTVPTYGEVKDGDRTVEIGDKLSTDALTGLMLDPKSGVAGSFVYKVVDSQGAYAEATVHLRQPADGELQAVALAAPASQVERSLTEIESPRRQETAPAAAGEVQIAMLETITGSNIRSAPDATSEWVASVPGGAQLKVVDKQAGVDWYQIETLEGRQGFISARLVRPIESQQAPDAAASAAPAPADEPARTAAETNVAALDLSSPDKISDLSEFTECADCPAMVALPAGSFRMGSDEGGRVEQPVREVTVGAPFAIGKYEVTVAQWKACAQAGACMDIGTLEPGDERRPMQNVSWPDAEAFAAWLSEATGEPYRLPTEAEWEYAARGGEPTAFWWGSSYESGRINCAECGGEWDRKNPSTVGSFEANPFGLHDMSGGVSEWVADCWNPSYEGAPNDASARSGSDCGQRVLRGGSWRSPLPDVTASSRFHYDSQVRYYTNGFRVARDLAN
ncbi:MAG: SUMF1/EgtB/PvdO family nonheme iron enzyme [Rhizobiales bacterium]|nr:SUMF1/EgtB/PvdO family nonheme iron enzyme [Hyphomicrobiales bacterium]